MTIVGLRMPKIDFFAAAPRSAEGKPPDFFSPQVSAARRFYLNLRPPEDQALVVVSGGCEHCRPDYAIHRASFPFYAIEFVARGTGRLRLGRREHLLQPGRVFAYGPKVRHDIVSAADDAMVKYFVLFSGTRARRLLRDCQLAPGQVRQLFPPNEVQSIFDDLINSGLRATRYTPELCRKLLECLVLKIAEFRAPLDGVETLSFTTYRHCRDHIQQHFQRLENLRQVAAECHVGVAYLCRLFQRYDHQSPYQYLRRLKMTLAAEWLRQPGVLVKQVSERVGFTDPFHFSRAFKAVFGLPPEAFRRLR